MTVLRSNGNTVGVSLGRPTGLGHHNGFTRRLSDLVDPAFDKLARLIGRGISIKEGVTVDGAEIGRFANLWVIRHGHHGIDGDNRARITSALEGTAGLSNSANDCTGIRSFVDQLVAHADGVDSAPVTVNCAGDCFALLLDLSDIKNAEEQFYVAVFGSCENTGDLVTIGTVQTNDLVAADFAKVRGDLLRCLAAVISIVRRVGYARGKSRSRGDRTSCIWRAFVRLRLLVWDRCRLRLLLRFRSRSGWWRGRRRRRRRWWQRSGSKVGRCRLVVINGGSRYWMPLTVDVNNNILCIHGDDCYFGLDIGLPLKMLMVRS